MLLVLLLAIAYLAYGIIEYQVHLKNLRTIPVRVHVNGTRGKSSVTRLIAAGLRAGGIRTVAKTTGSAARYIHPDGSEEPVSRPGPPNIKEQLAIVRRARQEGARALVIECMAIRPDLQWMSERKIVKSTVGVITNARPDHLDVMGPTVEDVARGLSSTVPPGQVVFTAEHERIVPIADAAKELRAGLFEIAADRYGPGVTEGFGYVEHAENIALALAVCEHVGVPKDRALEGMRTATPDIGALTIERVEHGGKTIEFVNAFAANDPESTATVWNAVEPRSVPGRVVIGIVSMRADRQDRALQYGELLVKGLDADHFILTGGLTHVVRSRAVAGGVPATKLIDMGGSEPAEIFAKIVELTPARSLAIGVGNIGGTGGKLLAHVRAVGTAGGADAVPRPWAEERGGKT